MAKRFSKVFLASACAFLFVAAGCNDDPVSSECSAPSGGPIEIVKPAGGETYTVGSTVEIELKFDKSQVDGVVPQVSIDSKLSWSDITTSQVSGDASKTNQCENVSWTIGSESESVSYSSTNTAYIRLVDYQDNAVNVVSESFTINQ